MIAHSINIAKSSNVFDEIIVSTIVKKLKKYRKNRLKFIEKDPKTYLMIMQV